MAGYAMVIGEALMDLLELPAEPDGERRYRETIGGAPLNVAVGVARLGAGGDAGAGLVGSVGDDVLARRIRAFLSGAGVDTTGLVTVPGPTTIALATFDGAEPSFSFYGSPPSYGQLTPSDVDIDRVSRAAALYAGSIALLCPLVLAAVRRAWAVPGPLRALDPNVRPFLLQDAAWLRGVIEELAATAHLVKMSAADADALYGEAPEEVADRLLAAGAGAVVVTRGADDVLLRTGGEAVTVPAPKVAAVDATGGGDAVMAGLMYGLVRYGLPPDPAGWVSRVEFAVAVAGVVVTRAGGATAMPTLAEVDHRLND